MHLIRLMQSKQKNQAEALLQPKENNSALVNAKQLLENAINQVPSTEGMTEQSIANYNAKTSGTN